MEALGINIVNLIINTVLFLIFFAILHKVVFKKLNEVLEQRKQTLDVGVQNTQKSKAFVISAQKESEEIKRKALTEAEQIIKEAKKLADAEGKKMLAKVELEAQAVREKSLAYFETHKQKLDQEYTERLEKAVKASVEKLFRENPELKA
jgi:F-type H+-transporting ATPase subunit b